MTKLFGFLLAALAALLRLALWLVLACVGLLALLVALLMLLLGNLWALLRGRRPSALVWWQALRQMRQMHATLRQRTAWPHGRGGAPHTRAPGSAEVVDVQAREVPGGAVPESTAPAGQAPPARVLSCDAQPASIQAQAGRKTGAPGLQEPD